MKTTDVEASVRLRLVKTTVVEATRRLRLVKTTDVEASVRLQLVKTTAVEAGGTRRAGGPGGMEPGETLAPELLRKRPMTRVQPAVLSVSSVGSC